MHPAPPVRHGDVIPLGDRALAITLAEREGQPALRDVVRCLDAAVRRRGIAGVDAVVPAIDTVTVHYDPVRIDAAALRGALQDTLRTLEVVPDAPREPLVIPVCYGGEFGPDLEEVARMHATTPEAIVAQHSAGAYTVAMLGFLPGFPYLHGLAPALHTPRRNAPRTRVPVGSVGIGGSSTGVYSCESPGGWNLIGRTPRALFDPTRAQPALLAAGDHVRFLPITPDAFAQWVDPT